MDATAPHGPAGKFLVIDYAQLKDPMARPSDSRSDTVAISSEPCRSRSSTLQLIRAAHALGILTDLSPSAIRQDCKASDFLAVLGLQVEAALNLQREDYFGAASARDAAQHLELRLRGLQLQQENEDRTTVRHRLGELYQLKG